MKLTADTMMASASLPQHPSTPGSTNVQLRPQKLSNEPRKARALIWACYCRACAVWFRLNTSTTQGEWKQSGFSNGFLFDSLFPQTDSELNNEFERAVKRGQIGQKFRVQSR